jgi:hypothetical protein
MQDFVRKSFDTTNIAFFRFVVLMKNITFICMEKSMFQPKKLNLEPTIHSFGCIDYTSEQEFF